MSIREKVDEYKKILDIFPNDQEKYQYLIEKAKENDSFPLELRLDNSVSYTHLTLPTICSV